MNSYVSTLSAECTNVDLPDELPVMVLSECWLFPGCLLPLFIFEERYRLMLEHALTTHRMFCIGTRSPDQTGVLPVSTAGIVRGCIKNEDGTSHLVLMGTRRIEFTGWVQGHPYPLAKIRALERAPCCSETVKTLRQEVMNQLPPCPEEASGMIMPLCEKLRASQDCEFVCDVLTYHFVRDPEVLNASLVEPSLEARYRLLLKELKQWV